MKKAGKALLFGLALWAAQVNATIVQFQTVIGDFEVNLFDETTPETVANFLEYVESQAYTDSFFHRAVPQFIVQGGGFVFDPNEQLFSEIDPNDPVVNEPELSNRRGTIAMAKLANDPNSATSQWFFNLVDNSANLDNQNGGFTVFGQVMGDGMDILDALGELNRLNASVAPYDIHGAFDTLPLRNFTQDDFDAQVPLSEEHLVMVNAVVVLDASPDTAADLNPEPNTSSQPPGNGSSGGGSGSSSGGGSAGLWVLLMLLLAPLGRRRLGFHSQP